MNFIKFATNPASIRGQKKQSNDLQPRVSSDCEQLVRELSDCEKGWVGGGGGNEGTK